MATVATKMTALADEVREISGVTNKLGIDAMTTHLDTVNAEVADQENLIAQISAALEGKTTATKDVVFYDYDGTVICSYTIEEANALTQMPTPPTHEGLVFQGWNHMLETINSLTTPAYVGAIYITDDGKTRLYIHLEKGRTSPRLALALEGTATVDWGDGTATDTITGSDMNDEIFTSNHNYASEGDYVISISVSGSMYLLGTWYSDTLCRSILCYSNEANNPLNMAYAQTLQKVELGNGIGSYLAGAFCGCTNLKSINVPNGITYLGHNTFGTCMSLSHINIPQTLQELSFAFLNSSISTISMPDAHASDDYGIYISDQAFRESKQLVSISLPNDNLYVNQSQFIDCYSLKNVIVNNQEAMSVLGEAFANCYSLENIVLPDSIETIGDWAFYDCRSLKNINTSNIRSIGYGAFSGCTSLKEIILPSSLTEIGGSAFANCSSLRKVILEGNLRIIPDLTFSDCFSMKEFHIHSATPPYLETNTVFVNTPSDFVIYVPPGSLNAYKTATNWSYYADHIREEGT